MITILLFLIIAIIIYYAIRTQRLYNLLDDVEKSEIIFSVIMSQSLAVIIISYIIKKMLGVYE